MNILMVEDEPMVREALSDFLSDQLLHKVTSCENGIEALEIFKKNPFPMVLTDVRMPRMDGIELLQSLKALPHSRTTDVVILTGHGDMKNAIEALRSGAYDYLLKPVNLEELVAVVDHIVEHQSLLQENYELSQCFEEKVSEATHETELEFNRLKTAYAEIVGIGKIGVFSNTIRAAAAMAERFHEDRSVPVLVEGETGTGKEIIARLVHYGTGDVTTPFVSINCSAISPNLFESELFGYEGGAFTGAKKEGMKGKFELAQGGTLFLDEIGDLPLELQPKLLRALQERELFRVGGLKKIEVDVRIICATNQNLNQLVEEESFRRDLFYRLNMGKIYIPPLSQRKEEIAPLAQMFLEQFSEQKKRRFRFITKDAVKILENHSWLGNVRELQNTIERIVLLYDDIEVRPEHLKFLTSDSNDEILSQSNILEEGSIMLPPDRLDLKTIESEIIRKALAMFDGNKSRTAAYLGLTRSALRSRIKKAY